MPILRRRVHDDFSIYELPLLLFRDLFVKLLPPLGLLTQFGLNTLRVLRKQRRVKDGLQ